MHALKVLGLLDSTAKTTVHHQRGIDDNMVQAHRQYLQSLIATKIGRVASRSNMIAFFESLEQQDEVMAAQQMDEVLEAMSYIGLLDTTIDPSPISGSSIAPADPPFSSIITTPMDSLCVLLEHRLRYCEGERDMVAMVHEVTGCFPSGIVEKHTSRLLAFGSSLSDGERMMRLHCMYDPHIGCCAYGRRYSHV